MASNPNMGERLDDAETFAPLEPVPLLREVAESQPYPVAALGPLQAAVVAVQRWTQAPAAIPAQSALSVAALALQGHAEVETLGGYRPLSLYCLTVAASGERKSSCDEKLMQAMQEFEREQGRAYRDARKAWAIDHAIWKKRHDKALRPGKGMTCDRRDLEALGPEPSPPPLPDRLVSEPTYEGLTRLFAEGQPTLGLFHDEGGQFLGGYAMGKDNKQKTLAAMNDLWQGKPIKRTRQGDGSFTLYGRRLSLHLMIQPVVAQELLSDPLASDTGFLPRCLICDPCSTIGTRLQSATVIDEGPIADFADRLGDILHTGMAMDPDTRELKPRRLPLSREARERLIAYSDHVEREQAPGGQFETIKGFASKSAEQAARIAGVLTLWADLSRPEVSGEAMTRAIVLAGFYLSEALRLAGAAAVSAPVAKAEQLRKWMLSDSWGASWLTTTAVLQRGPNRLRENPEARAAIEVLVENGHLIPLPRGTEIEGRKVREAWRINR